MKRLLLFLAVFTFTIAQAHPLKMAYTAVKYNAAKQVFEISHRVFQDDFEMTLKTRYGYTGGDVVAQQTTQLTQKAVNGFFEKNFSIKFNNKTLKTRYLRTEQKNQMGIVVTYETERVDAAALKSISVYNYIMIESFREQVNMFNLNMGDYKRTLKFDIDKTKDTITLD